MSKTTNLRVDGKHQLFVDDFLVESMDHLKRTFHPMQKPYAEPVLYPLTPWEGNGITRGTVLRDENEGLFKMWYNTGLGKKEEPETRTFVCYVTSTDGIYWVRPELGLYPYRGVWENNIVFRPYIGEDATCRIGVFNLVKDYKGDGYPYKGVCFYFNAMKMTRDIPHPSGVYTVKSPDGIHWEENPSPIFLFTDGVGDSANLMYDSIHKRYICFIKTYTDQYGNPLRRIMDKTMKILIEDKKDEWIEPARDTDVIRCRSITTSEDFLHWTEPRYIPFVDSNDPHGTQAYANISFLYESMYLGFLVLYHPLTTGNHTVELIISRDGDNWQRPDERVTIWSSGRLDRDWDYGCIALMNNPPIRVGDELRIYYSVGKRLHSGQDRGDPLISYIGLATLRLDGFASMDAKGTEGILTTIPIQPAGSHIYVNADASNGEVAVQILDESGRVLPGYAYEYSLPICKDGTCLEVKWKESVSRSPILGQTVRFQFRLRQASIYSFWVEP